MTLKRKRGPDGHALGEFGDWDIALAIGRQANAEDSSEDEAFIWNAQHKQNVRAGADVVKMVKGKGHSHVKKGELGGGSFQSMGE